MKAQNLVIVLLVMLPLSGSAKFTPKEVVLIRRIQGNVQQLKVQLRESNDSNEVTRVQLEHAQQQTKDIQVKIDGRNAQIASLSKKLGHYETAWSVIAAFAAGLVAFLVFRLVGFVLPWGLIAVGTCAAAAYAAVFFAPNFL